ncbi:hypothetical protein LOZ80_09740 [Paenibacillus sp. HWE-109]|uniref:hypothetical protein n=1 Tax=Paenibacillus sp. HWE-109 TaxID=1306526 RepID=UPI001EDD63E7|nr:hypothetical protein [Paenibacillus sp. HWE-109]UKS29189.1 hypothetical protein LOZ80_09740 [Paenibacillus sp. HWE-109]
MQELVGHCHNCQKEIYCLDGFFTGVIFTDKTLLCFTCAEDEQAENNRDLPTS